MGGEKKNVNLVDSTLRSNAITPFSYLAFINFPYRWNILLLSSSPFISLAFINITLRPRVEDIPVNNSEGVVPCEFIVF